MTDSEWLHYRDLKSRCPACKRPAHIAKRDETFYFVDDEYNPFVRHAPVKTTEAVFRFFVESYRRNHGTEPEVTGNRVVSKQDLLSGMHMVSAERNSTTGRSRRMNDCDGVKTTRQKKDSCGTTRNESPFARFFGNALRNARMMRGMTQEQFAAELGIPKYSIRAYEQGRRFPKYETLDSICETLGISPEYLYCLGIMNANEFVHTLFSLEDRFHLYPDMDGAIRFGMGEVQNAMVEWAEQYGKYTSGEITLEEYKDWKRKYQADEPEDESRSDDSFLKDKPVVCLECEERFASIGDAAAKLHLNARKLGNAIRENEPYHGLHFFLIAESWQDETK